MYKADSFLNGITDMIQKEFSAELSVRLLHLIESASSQATAGEGTWLLEITSTQRAYS